MATPEDDPDMEWPDMDRPDMLAAELALGVLEGDDRAVALRRLVAEPAFALEVERWRDRFAALFAIWPGAEAPAGVATRIEASLDARGHGRDVAANDDAAVARWRGWAIGASIAACLLLAVTTLLMLRPAPAPERIPIAVPGPAPMIAALAPTQKGTPIAVAYDGTNGEVRIAGDMTVPAGHVAEVWAIQGKAAPRSLGLMPVGGQAKLTVPTAIRGAMTTDTVLAISIEPFGGSPTGLPTGPVVAAGKLNG